MPVLKAGERYTVSFALNGRQVSARAEPRLLLSDFLRHELGATGTHAAPARSVSTGSPRARA